MRAACEWKICPKKKRFVWIRGKVHRSSFFFRPPSMNIFSHIHTYVDENFPCGFCLVSIEHVLWFLWWVNGAVTTDFWETRFKLHQIVSNLTVSFGVYERVCVRTCVWHCSVRDELKSLLSFWFSFIFVAFVDRIPFEKAMKDVDKWSKLRLQLFIYGSSCFDSSLRVT